MVVELFNPSNDSNDLREGVAKLCEYYPAAYWEKLDSEKSYPIAFVRALAQFRYLSVLIPKEYGGPGLKFSDCAAILEEVHRAGCNAEFCHSQMYTIGTLLRHSKLPQKQRWFPRMASGELRLQAFGVEEMNGDAHASTVKAFARRAGDHYVINGKKIWTGRIENSDLMILLARTAPIDRASPKADCFSAFVIDIKASCGNGLSIRPIWTTSHPVSEALFVNLQLPVENLIGDEGDGLKIILSSINAEKILVASEYLGDAKWFIQRASKCARERTAFGRPIWQIQKIQFSIAKSSSATRRADLIVREAARLYGNEIECGALANIAKMHAIDAACQAVNSCKRTTESAGLVEEFEVERKCRERGLHQVAPISTDHAVLDL